MSQKGFGLIDAMIAVAVAAFVFMTVQKTTKSTMRLQGIYVKRQKELDVEGALRSQIASTIEAQLLSSNDPPVSCFFGNEGIPTRCEEWPTGCKNGASGAPAWIPDRWIVNYVLSGWDDTYDPNVPGFRVPKGTVPLDALKYINLMNRWNQANPFTVKSGGAAIATETIKFCAHAIIDQINIAFGSPSGPSWSEDLQGRCFQWMDHKYTQEATPTFAIIARVQPYRYDFSEDRYLTCNEYVIRHGEQASVGIRAYYSLVLVSSTPPRRLNGLQDIIRFVGESQYNQWLAEGITVQEILDHFDGKTIPIYKFDTKIGWVNVKK